MSDSKVYRVAVRLTREWIVYVSAPDGEVAEEHACDIPEDELGEPLVEDLDAEVQSKIGPNEVIPEGAPTFPPGLGGKPQRTEDADDDGE